MGIKAELIRKLIHLSSIWMIVAIYFLDHNMAIILFSVMLIALFIFEYIRMSNQYMGNIISKYCGSIMRGHEYADKFRIRALSGSFYFILAVLLSVILLPKNIAMISIAVMIFSDTMAALIGKQIGKVKILDKSLEGSISFLITTYIILYFTITINIYQILLISLAVTLVELISNKIKIDDNLSITATTGLLLFIFT